MRFNYEALSPSVASFLRGQAERIRRTATSSVVNIGKDLVAPKRYLSHGVFLKWLEVEIDIPARTAQVYMQVAKWLGHKNATFAHLPLSTLYVLSAPGTPNEFAINVLNRMQGGESVSAKSVREELKSLRVKPKDASNEHDNVELIEANQQDKASREEGRPKICRREIRCQTKPGK